MEIRIRSALVEARTSLINAARGVAKGMGVRLPSCDAATLPERLCEQMQPLLAQVARPFFYAQL